MSFKMINQIKTFSAWSLSDVFLIINALEIQSVIMEFVSRIRETNLANANQAGPVQLAQNRFFHDFTVNAKNASMVIVLNLTDHTDVNANLDGVGHNVMFLQVFKAKNVVSNVIQELVLSQRENNRNVFVPQAIQEDIVKLRRKVVDYGNTLGRTHMLRVIKLAQFQIFHAIFVKEEE